MLQIKIKGRELFDESKNEFIDVKDQTLQLEHSLVSISKWESKWHKPFLSKDPRTMEESLDYIRCMTINKNVDPLIYQYCIDPKTMAEINAYIDDPSTATWFNDKDQHKSREIITSELIYYSMTALNIPFECEKWHLNRLLTLIRVCSIKSQPQKKMSKRDVMSRNRSLNAMRRARSGSKG